MNWAQWVAEYHALLKKDKEQVDLVVRAMDSGFQSLREMLVGVLGLNLVHRSQLGEAAKDLPEHVTPFIPFSMLVSRPDVIKKVQEEYEAASSASRGVEDDAFEAFSKDLQRRLEEGDLGDMEPLFGSVEMSAKDRYFQRYPPEMLRNLGVRLMDEEEAEQRKEARKEIDEIVQEVVSETGKPTEIRPTSDVPSGPAITFFDDDDAEERT
jgi:hypothetical protein